MTDLENKTTPLPPIAITLVGTGDGGGIPQGTVAQTPHGIPNVVVNLVSPALAIAIRFVNFYLTTLIGLVPAALTPKGAEVMDALGAKDFFQVLVACGSIAVAPATLNLLKDLVTLFGDLEKKHPILTGNI